MSGRFAEMMSAGMARGVRRLRPMRPSTAPTRLCVRLSTNRGGSERLRLLVDHPGLALADQSLEVCLLARRCRFVLLPDGAFEGRRWILVDDAERDREALRHFDQHRGDALVLRVVDDDGRILAVDDLQAQAVDVERK